MSKKCLVEVEFDGPEAEKGPEVLIKLSNGRVQDCKSYTLGIPMPGIDAYTVGYKLVEEGEKVAEKPPDFSSLGYFILGSLASGVLAWLI